MLKVVIMDGNAISRGLLSSVITNGGHLVVGDMNVSAVSIARAVKLKPQLICIDLAQVEGDPMAVLDQMKADLPKTLVFLVSNSFNEDAIRQGQAHGAKGFIVKPFNSVKVLTTIRNAVMRFVAEMRKAHIKTDMGDVADDASE